MTKRKTVLKIRKAHRYLGLFLGIQFLLWTISGLYFSWTDIDEIHGDHFKKLPPEKASFSNLLGTSDLQVSGEIESLELLEIAGKPFYWINDSKLLNASTGELREKVSPDEALLVAAKYLKSDLKVSAIKQIDSVGPHHEYRGRPLPAYEISYNSPEKIKSFVAVNNGAFQTVRHRNWRWFDFLWMTHTMDYQGRDNFNTILLRAFSLLGLTTVMSGFTLWFVSSPSLRKIFKSKKAP
ncbi:PepSY domain-containing protein [Croceitalea rosinachiae]|uniref:PepSY domain-containing protein n=1 Tax=Croceitalea rosinachiae TaxID=3075596 RepID=A0ABU3A9A7_9FLAO|nr:PepSY domain-containing protein [Croceitalea sp. F388]MDT0606772.1 PepSY domain-containing protein [Croceitalea sp. F388]